MSIDYNSITYVTQGRLNYPAIRDPCSKMINDQFSYPHDIHVNIANYEIAITTLRFTCITVYPTLCVLLVIKIIGTACCKSKHSVQGQLHYRQTQNTEFVNDLHVCRYVISFKCKRKNFVYIIVKNQITLKVQTNLHCYRSYIRDKLRGTFFRKRFHCVLINQSS